MSLENVVDQSKNLAFTGSVHTEKNNYDKEMFYFWYYLAASKTKINILAIEFRNWGWADEKKNQTEKKN